ncbi:MAG: aminoglycoside phosphotransferase family protein [Actinomycetota bacterium]
MIEVPELVERSALAAGAASWLAALPDLVGDLATEWELSVGGPLPGGTESCVVGVTQADGTPAVLKLLLPRTGDEVVERAGRHEAAVLRLADGDGCVRLFRSDLDGSALLLERLGPSLSTLGLPIGRRLEIMTATVARLWRRAPTDTLPSGAARASQLVRSVIETWERLDRPCSERVVEHAVRCGERRRRAHDDERIVLVHGDVHQWNTLASDRGFLLIDPDGLRAEPEYDLGILMREDPVELVTGRPRDRAEWLASRCGLDAEAIWEWGVIERVANGLSWAATGDDDEADRILRVAEVIAADPG